MIFIYLLRLLIFCVSRIPSTPSLTRVYVCTQLPDHVYLHSKLKSCFVMLRLGSIPLEKMDLHEDEQVRTFSCATRFKWSGNYGNNDHGKAQIHLTQHNSATKKHPQRHNEARKGAQASKNGPQKQTRGAKMTTWRQTMEF